MLTLIYNLFVKKIFEGGMLIYYCCIFNNVLIRCIMKIVDPVIFVENYDSQRIMKNIERACRTCYKSENLIANDSYQKLLRNCINRGHESILEHEKISVRMICDIGVYKDLTRHRFASFSIESTRYCNYSKDKFDNEIKFIKPVHIEENSEIYEVWKKTMENIEQNYIEMSKLDAKPDQLRMILPHSTAAEVYMTANIREWRHILSLRCSKMTHPAVRQLLIPLLLKFQNDMPELFDNIEYDTEFSRNKFAKLEIID